MKIASFPNLLQAFFYDRLGHQRNLSHYTVMSYRDTWRLFLRFVCERSRKSIAAITLNDMDAATVLAFLRHLEEERKVCVGTRNCRLAAVHAFFDFVAEREPSLVAQCAEIARIPSKRTNRPTMCYLEEDEIIEILKQPNSSTTEGQRDHVLFSLLYNTGARIQEALNITPGSIRFDSPAHVHLIGKGKKERICPLWPETVTLLKALLRRQPRADDEPIFVNCYGQPLGAAGVRFKLNQYVQAAAQTMPSLRKKKISPHVFRHSAGVMLVAAGVDITVIRNWLGHAHLDTTNLYARANLETKRKALEQVDPSSRPGKPPRWKKDAELLAWLDSL